MADACERSEKTFGFNKVRGMSWLVEGRLASQGGLCCLESYSFLLQG